MKQMNNIKLYVRRVFIMDKIENLMPSYLCFIKGVVDSEDLPLNISRETLQQNKIIKIIRKHIIKKSLDLIMDIAEDKEKYKGFYQNFSKNIKLGIHEDNNNKDRLAKLLRYQSMNSNSELISLDEYKDNMKDTQKGIYYITGESIDSIKDSPFIEKLRRKGYDVLYMIDAIDEYCMQQLKIYENCNLICITKENLDIEDDEEKIRLKTRTEELKPLCDHIKQLLNKGIEKVVVSQRLVSSPCTLVTGQFGWTANMERLVKAQALQSNSNQMQSQIMATRKTMELNPDHPIILKLEKLLNDKEEALRINEIVLLLYNTSLISSGFTLNEPTTYTNRINRLIAMGLDIDDMDEWEENLKETKSNLDSNQGGEDSKVANTDLEQDKDTNEDQGMEELD
jgi:molecular chaperone HtpG